MSGPAKTSLGSLSVRQVVTGLWQMADQERDGKAFDLDAAAEALVAYARDGFDTFDMADHYGSAEIVAGKAHKLLREAGETPPTILTKWCPPPGEMSLDTVRAGVETALRRLDLPRVDLMQFHWWQYQSPEYLDALAALMKLREEGLIGEIGLTNFDADHLRLVLKQGIEVASNQVCFSLLDRRAAGRLSTVALDHDVKLLAFGTLCGGFLSDRWVGAEEPDDIADWSRMKYKRFIDAGGGWAPFQGLMETLSEIAKKRDASVANVATRWVLDHRAVASVIVGARLGENQHRNDNARLDALSLNAEDLAAISAATDALDVIPGDCGDEYRKPPFLTASGDLGDHLEALPKVFPSASIPGPAGSESRRFRINLGRGCRVQPRGASRQSYSGQRNDRNGRARQRRSRGRCRGAGSLCVGQDRCRNHLSWGPTSRRDPHSDLHGRPGRMGGRQRRPRPRLRRHPACQHLGRNRRTDRALSDRD